MAKKYFWKHLMSSDYDGSKLVKGRFYADAAPAEVHDGAIVVVGGLEDHAVYTGMKDLDTRKITAPTAVTDSVAIVDLVNVSEGHIMGELYREGTMLLPSARIKANGSSPARRACLRSSTTGNSSPSCRFISARKAGDWPT